MQATFKLPDIARDRRKTSKKETEKRKIRKTQTATKKFFFYFYFFIKKFISYLEKHRLYCYICITAFLAGYCECIDKTPTPRYALVLLTPYFEPKYLGIGLVF